MAVAGCTHGALTVEPGVSEELARERSERISGLSYRLFFDIPERLEEPCSGTVSIGFELKGTAPLQLDFRPQSVQDLSVNGTPAPVKWKSEHILLEGLREGHNELRLSFAPEDAPLNRHEDYLYTLLVPERARTLFPCFDQPDLKARFALELELPDAWEAVANGPLEADGSRDAAGTSEAGGSREGTPGANGSKSAEAGGTPEAGGSREVAGTPGANGGRNSDGGMNAAGTQNAGGSSEAAGTQNTCGSLASGRKRLRFAPTEPISTYLFAFAAGRWETATFERNGAPMRILYRETDPAKLAQLPEIHRQICFALDWMEEFTAIGMPFPKYDCVIVPGFQFGGMEHPGAIFYSESRMFLSNAPTDADRCSRIDLIAHETAHLWFGDAVTQRWFNDVWTKEVFANYFAAQVSRPLFPDIDFRTKDFRNFNIPAYAEDRSAGSNPIRQQLDNLQDAGLVYGNIVYDKAPVVMRMLADTLGADAFRAGMREYLGTFMGGNASWPELIGILDSHTDADLAAWSHRWVEEKGMPEHPETDGLPNLDALGYGYYPMSERALQEALQVRLPKPHERLSNLANLYENMLHGRVEPLRVADSIFRLLRTEDNDLVAAAALSYLSDIWHLSGNRTHIEDGLLEHTGSGTGESGFRSKWRKGRVGVSLPLQAHAGVRAKMGQNDATPTNVCRGKSTGASPDPVSIQGQDCTSELLRREDKDLVASSALSYLSDIWHLSGNRTHIEDGLLELVRNGRGDGGGRSNGSADLDGGDARALKEGDGSVERRKESGGERTGGSAGWDGEDGGGRSEGVSPQIRLQAFRILMHIATRPETTEALYQLWARHASQSGHTLPEAGRNGGALAEKYFSGLALAEEDYTSLAFELAIRLPERYGQIGGRQRGLIENADRRSRFDFVFPAAHPSQAVRDSVFRSLLSPENRTTEPWVQQSLRLLNHPLRQKEALGYIVPGLDELQEIQRTGDIFFPKNWAVALLSGHDSPEAASLVRSWLSAHPDYPPLLRNKLLQASDRLLRQ